MLLLLLLLESRINVVLLDVLRVCLLLIEVVEVVVAKRSVIIVLCKRRWAVQRRASIYIGLAVEVGWCVGCRYM